MSDFNIDIEVSVREQKRGIEKIASWCLTSLFFLLPIFFVPASFFPFQFSKSILLSVLVLVAFCLWIIARLRDGQFVIPRSPILISLATIGVLFVLSSIFSGSFSDSFFGEGLEVGTTISFLVVTLLAILIPTIYTGREMIFGGYLAFLAAFFLIALFHLLRLLFGPDFLSVGIFPETVSNTIGKWNDLGVFFGVSALLSLITLEFLSLNKLFKILISLALGISLFLLAIVNFPPIWFVLALFSLVFLVYLLSFGRARGAAESVDPLLGEVAPSKRIPFSSLAVLIVSVVFVLAGDTIGTALSSAFNISPIEARPTWGATFDMARQTLNEQPLLGSGPNQFTSQWLLYKPDGVNGTIFWSTDFSYGVGLIPTFLVTTGILGIIGWVIFFALFLYAGFKTMLGNITDMFSQYLFTSSFFVALFLWIFSIFYIPSLTIFVFTFLFTGLFVAVLVIEGLVPVKTISFIGDPRANFVSVLLLILLLIGSVTLGYSLVQRYTATVLFRRGVFTANTTGNIDLSKQSIARAAAMSPQDAHYRFLSELELASMGQLIRRDPKVTSPEVVRSELQTLLGNALRYARRAVALNALNYENFLSLGRVYEAVVPLGIEGAYESATASYESARSLNPKNPAILLVFARLENAHGDNAAAREYIGRALEQKGNYTEAIFLLSQIETQEGNTDAAIRSVEAASIISPDNATIFFQLGLLRFNERNYLGAAEALARAVELSPVYANARYFLGLSYNSLDRSEDAIAQFTELKRTNPDNAEIDLILSNLEAGRDPFSDAEPPIDATPERRSELPLDEEETPAEE